MRQRRGSLAPIDPPLGASVERYRVTLSGQQGSLELECAQPSITIGAADLAAIGPGAAQLQVRQVGDYAASHPTEYQLILS